MQEKYCTSLELSKRLKELGILQKSELVWCVAVDGDDVHTELRPSNKRDWYINGEEFLLWEKYSAFHVGELGELLPEYYLSRKHFGVDKNWHWRIYSPYEEDYISAELISYEGHEANTEAEARGLMLEYLAKEGLLK